MKTIIGLFLSTILLGAVAHAQTTAFTYQGKLNNNGVPANGIYDFQFTVYDAVTNVSSTLQKNATSVSNGLFTVQLDFGASVFEGSDRWIDIGVRTNGAGLFATLNPRQPLTSTPYAIRAGNAAVALVASSANSVAAANISGTIPIAQLPSSVITNGASGVNISGTFTGNGAGISNVFANSLLNLSHAVVAWGFNGSGQTNVPPALGDVIALAAGSSHCLALRSDGTVAAWGLNNFGQATVPAGLRNVVAIAAGQVHSVALKKDGTVVAWGYNDEGESTVPAGLTDVIAISASLFDNLALKSNGTVVFWGTDYFGVFTPPAGLSNVVAIASGTRHNLALKKDGTVVAWGLNDYGAISVPPGLTNVIAISAGYDYSLALKSDGTVVAWGDNQNGQSTVPAGLTNVTAIAGGLDHSLALKSDGTVVVWGTNSVGQLNVPAGLTNVTSIAAGGSHSLALYPTINPATLASLDGPNTFTAPNTFSSANNSFTGNGAGLTSLNASELTSGVVPDARLSSNVALLNANQAFSGTNSFTGSVGIGGSNSGSAKLYVTAPGTINGNNTADFYAPAIGGNHSHIHYGTTGDWFIRSAANTGKVVLQDSGGNVGIGTSSPSTKLTVSDTNNNVALLQSSSTIGTWLGLNNSASGSQWSFVSTGSGNAEGAGKLVFYRNPEGRRMMLDGSGNLTTTGTVNGSSDRNIKHNFEPVDAKTILDKVSAMPIHTWSYTNDTADIRHIGPVAQDFYSAFAVGPDDKHISMVDADGVALAAIQGLNQKLEAKESKIQQLEKRNQTLEQRLSDLEKLVQKLSEQK